MDELYEFLKESLGNMRIAKDNMIVIDMDHALRLFHMVCYMMQIRGIIKFQDDMCADGRKKDDTQDKDS